MSGTPPPPELDYYQTAQSFLVVYEYTHLSACEQATRSRTISTPYSSTTEPYPQLGGLYPEHTPTGP